METKFKEDQFSLLRAIKDKMNRQEFDTVTKHVFNEGKENLRKIGMLPIGDLCIPLDLNVPNFRADILAGTATAGQEIVGEGKANLLEPLRNKSVLLQGGATFVTGLSADYSLPELQGSVGNWKSEVDTADDGAGATPFSDIDFLPHRVTAILNYSRLFLVQDSVEAEKIFFADLISACITRLEQTILSNDAAVGGVSPAGFLQDTDDVFSGVAGVTWTQAVSLATKVQESLAWGINNVGYIVHPSLAGLLKETEKVATTGEMIIKDNMLNGYKIWETGNMSKTLHTTNLEYGLAFANFSHIIITQWGGIDLVVDPFTSSKEGKVRVIVNAYFDAKLRSDAAMSFGSATLA
ncbi:hypothetical protein ES705_15614 [subsurface metagenome]